MKIFSQSALIFHNDYKARITIKGITGQRRKLTRGSVRQWDAHCVHMLCKSIIHAAQQEHRTLPETPETSYKDKVQYTVDSPFLTYNDSSQ